MEFTLAHYVLMPKLKATDPEYYRFAPELPDNDANWLTANAKHGLLEPVRRINWPRSFAMKGLNYDDYYLIHRDRSNVTGDETYYFKLRASIASKSAKADVLFERSDDRTSNLQGEVLTYESLAPTFTGKIKVHVRMRVDVLPPRIFNRQWITSEADMWSLHSQLLARDEKARELFKHEFCDRWLDCSTGRPTVGCSIAQLTI